MIGTVQSTAEKGQSLHGRSNRGTSSSPRHPALQEPSDFDGNAYKNTTKFPANIRNKVSGNAQDSLKFTIGKRKNSLEAHQNYI